MRIIAQLKNMELAEKFSAFLSREKIENSIEPNFNLQTEQTEASIWVHDEDDLQKAEEHYKHFCEHPEDPMFNIVSMPPVVEEKKIPESDDSNYPNREDVNPYQVREKPVSKKGVTFLFIFICAAIYFISSLQSFQVKKAKTMVPYSAIQLALFYDEPAAVDLLKKALVDEPKGIYTNPDSLSPSQQLEVSKILTVPRWEGIYPLLLPKKEDGKELLKYPPFRKILQGQVWRTFTPCLLHADILHILFNMLWLWVLGKQVERRLSFLKCILLIVTIGIISNMAQYLAGGPFFLGFSGVVLGLAGFIWSRQKVAPWEGHLIHPSTFVFLAFFVLAMCFYQFLSFFMELFGSSGLPPFIANTAHVVGAITGIILGRLSFFSWRPRE